MRIQRLRSSRESLYLVKTFAFRRYHRVTACRDKQIESVDQYVSELLNVRTSEVRRRNNVDMLFRGQDTAIGPLHMV